MPRTDPERQRQYVRDHYKNNKQYYVDKARKQTLARRAFLADSKTGKPCMDCGTIFPHYVMEYDHRPGEVKIGHVTTLVTTSSMSKLIAEIAKCDLVCSNCHKIRTWTRAHVA